MSHPMAGVENGPSQTVFRGGPSMLVTPLGHPVPPQNVVERLRQISSRYSIEWLPGAWGTACFALFEKWAERDERWEQVQRGAVDPARARDIMCTFPPDCGANDMAAWVESKFGKRVADPYAEADRMIAEALKMRQAADAAAVDKVVETGTDRFLGESDHLRAVNAGVERAHPMVAGMGEGTMREPKRLIPKGA